MEKEKQVQNIKKEVEEIERYINQKQFEEAFKKVINLPEAERKEEVKKIFEGYIQIGLFDSARKIASYIPEPDRSEELKKIEEIYRKAKWYVVAVDMALLLSEPYKTQELKKIIEECATSPEWINFAYKIVDYLPEADKNQEIEKIKIYEKKKIIFQIRDTFKKIFS